MVAIDVRWEEVQPSADRVLECFGEPGLYQATYKQDVEAKQLAVQFWYPSQGLIVTGVFHLS